VRAAIPRIDERADSGIDPEPGTENAPKNFAVDLVGEIFVLGDSPECVGDDD
jgi:hypothetical protein